MSDGIALRWVHASAGERDVSACNNALKSLRFWQDRWVRETSHGQVVQLLDGMLRRTSELAYVAHWKRILAGETFARPVIAPCPLTYVDGSTKSVYPPSTRNSCVDVLRGCLDVYALSDTVAQILVSFPTLPHLR